jgi:uncharacterized protein YyaL (SSP411 family)
MPNRLIDEKSPYLIQHAHNPVDWWSWSETAFDTARRENKPIFLSVGYATCHWCHVMERESFEDAEAARHLNETFVCIKVDREERPDIDAVYMAACQMMTGRGGWPLTVFMTPDRKPFFAATYIPRQSRFGQPGLIDLCRQVRQLWQDDHQKVLNSAAEVSGGLGRAFAFSSGQRPDEGLLDQAYRDIQAGYDERFGGFENAPKFPTPHRLIFLLRRYHRTGRQQPLEMVEKTLTAMRLGGVWDHVGFGFHRYSTDREWLLPHFEKMLYDQAFTALAYLETFQITSDRFYGDTAREIFAYVMRDMQAESGGFYAAEDADSEGEEGKFYVWTEDEFRRVLGEDLAAVWAPVLNLQQEGNFQDEASGRKTGANILHLQRPPREIAQLWDISVEEYQRRWSQVRTRLYEQRKKRIHPLKDDKVLTDWNGMMVAAMARGGRILQDDTFTAAARRAAAFILERMCDSDANLFHRYREGEVAISGKAEDYAFLIFGLLELYLATFDPRWLAESVRLQTRMIEKFWDSENGGFYSTPAGETDLPVRPKELYDGATPSGNSTSLYNLLVLGRLTGDARWHEKAEDLLQAFAGTVNRMPAAFSFFLVGIDFALHPGQDVVITGEPEAEDTLALLQSINVHFTPHGLTMVKSEQNAEELERMSHFTRHLQSVKGRATAHICKGSACRESTTDADTLVTELLGENRGAGRS